MQRFLFDRLCQPLQTEPTNDFSQIAQLRQSITEELQRIVSGKAYFDGIRLGYAGHRSVLNWGVDNPVDLSANLTDVKSLMSQVLELIRTYEPRIINPQVQLLSHHSHFLKHQIEVHGHIEINKKLASFSHRLTLGGQQA